MQAHWQNERDAIDRIRVLKEQLETASLDADRLEREGDLARASEMRYGTLPDLIKPENPYLFHTIQSDSVD